MVQVLFHQAVKNILTQVVIAEVEGDEVILVRI